MKDKKNINSYPIETIKLKDAIEMQFNLVQSIHDNFNGEEILNMGDLGLVGHKKYPNYTQKVENAISKFFNVEDTIMVRSAGSGAIRDALSSVLKANDSLIVHNAPIYPTTKVFIEDMCLKAIKLDYNSLSQKDLSNCELDETKVALIQHSRQKLDDNYTMQEVIKTIKNSRKDIAIVTDENYVVLKAKKIGCQLGADLSTFSFFKLLGPTGIGCVLGKKKYIDTIRKKQYSGGSKVQGYEAMDCLRAMVYAPVSLAIQAEVSDRVVERIENEKIRGIKNAYIANAQSRVIIVVFEEDISKEVLKESVKYGAAPFPVGSESKFEISAMFYRVSGTFIESFPHMENNSIRINPMRAGADTIINILKSSINDVYSNKNRL